MLIDCKNGKVSFEPVRNHFSKSHSFSWFMTFRTYSDRQSLFSCGKCKSITKYSHKISFDFDWRKKSTQFQSYECLLPHVCYRIEWLLLETWSMFGVQIWQYLLVPSIDFLNKKAHKFWSKPCITRKDFKSRIFLWIRRMFQEFDFVARRNTPSWKSSGWCCCRRRCSVSKKSETVREKCMADVRQELVVNIFIFYFGVWESEWLWMNHRLTYLTAYDAHSSWLIETLRQQLRQEQTAQKIVCMWMCVCVCLAVFWGRDKSERWKWWLRVVLQEVGKDKRG